MSASNLFESCVNNVFPSLHTMSKYGLDGNGGTNPMDILKCYSTAIKEGKLSQEELEKTKDLNNLILQFNKSKDYYNRVKKSGGIQISVTFPNHVECSKCNYCGIATTTVCPNCQLKF
jgi:hypothetical protein